MLVNSVSEIIGRTPLLRLNNVEVAVESKAALMGKLEAINPSGSVKDRAALYMIEDAEKRGILKKGGTIIEPTSGNTGIGLASIATSRGYKAVLVMPESMSVERRKLLKAYGAEIVLTAAPLGMMGAVEKAKELEKEIKGSVIMSQFSNQANAKAHYETTGPEIWEDTVGKVDILIGGFGTGGTLTGTGRFLKEKNPDLKIIALEPETSPLLSEGKAGKHGIQGIGANFIPELLDQELIDEVMKVGDDESYEYARALGTKEGVLCGISSGAALFAGVKAGLREENRGKNIVMIFPDTGERYLSTELYKI